MDRVESKQAKAAMVTTMRQLARSNGFRTRSQFHYSIHKEFLLYFCADYLDSATVEYAKGDARLIVNINIKASESDRVLWRICQMADELDKHSIDPIFGLDVVPGVQIAEQTFRVAALDDTGVVCQDAVDFATTNFTSFLDSLGNSLEGFYRYVIGLDPKNVWRDEVVFPIAYIQLGDYRAALSYLNKVGCHTGQLLYLSKNRFCGDYLADYCRARLGESRPVESTG